MKVKLMLTDFLEIVTLYKSLLTLYKINYIRLYLNKICNINFICSRYGRSI